MHAESGFNMSLLTTMNCKFSADKNKQQKMLPNSKNPSIWMRIQDEKSNQENTKKVLKCQHKSAREKNQVEGFAT